MSLKTCGTASLRKASPETCLLIYTSSGLSCKRDSESQRALPGKIKVKKEKCLKKSNNIPNEIAEAFKTDANIHIMYVTLPTLVS